ncbi:MAG: YitT family protein [Paludibacteraceae bacterium]|nr:YitT family protein [Paludibacteraceae bacterium]
MNVKEKQRLEEVKEHISAYRKMRPYIEAKELILIALSTIPYAIAVNKMLVPHNIVSGGLTGLCEIIYFATDRLIPIWLSTFILNALLLSVAIKLIGWRFCARTIYGVAWLTIWFKVIEIEPEPIVHDPFMACVLGGLMCGCGLGLVFLNNGSTGGTDIIAMLVNKYAHLSMGRVLLYCDLIIISSAYFLPNVHSIEKVLFGLTFTFMATTAVDWIMNRSRQSVQFFIFSKRYAEIADAILYRVPRGVTILDGEGWFSKQPMKIVTVLARKSESGKIFKLVREIDPEAFISQSQTIGVFGKGFDSYK